MRIQLSDHFTYKRLFQFVIPTIIMMIINALYSIVDGIFVSNFVGKTAFAAVNLVMPVMMSVGSIGYMVGAGGSAIIAITLGEGKKELANQRFSMLVYAIAGASVILSVFGYIFLPHILAALGAESELMEAAVTYGRILFVSQTAVIMQNCFQMFCSTAEKPALSLKTAIAAGVTNMLLDFLFIAIFHWGIQGAAIATAIGQFLGAAIPLIYFSRRNSSLLRLTKAKLDWRILLCACGNGSSEMVSNLSASIVSTLYNYQLMKLAGENGVAAYGSIMYISYIFSAVFWGYSIGSSPVIGYHYGAENTDELKNMFRKSIMIILCIGGLMTLSGELFASPLTAIFTGYDAVLFEMTRNGFRIYAFAFILSGMCIWSSGFFTALGDGTVSAIISFLRTFLFQISAVLILPALLGISGVWMAIVAADLLAVMVTVIFLISKRKKYKYF